MAIEAGGGAAGPKPGDQARPGAPGALEVAEEPCPEGLVTIAGKCTAPVADAAHQCDPGDLDDCTKQCEKKHGGSCGALAAIYANGLFVGGTLKVAMSPANDRRAADLLRTACDLHDTRGCVTLGEFQEQGRGVPKDPSGAGGRFERAVGDT